MATKLAGKGTGPVAFLEARLLFSAFIAMGMMEFTFVLYGDAVFADPNDPGTKLIYGVGRWALAVFSTPVYLLLGVPLLRGAWLDLKQRRVRMDGLIAIATIASFVLSVTHTLRGQGAVYYETATMVLVLVTLGRRLEAHARTKGKDAAQTLADLLPPTAHKEGAEGAIEDVSPDALVAGDRVRILPGEAFPADVLILEGKSEVTAAHLTGESKPIEIGPGAEAAAGALNGTGLVIARVVRRAVDGSFGHIKKLLDSPLGMTRLIRIADQWSGYLVFIAIGLAVIGFVRSTMLAGAGEGTKTALSVLLVACPCALGLAAPLAYRAMRAALARAGVLVGDPRALESAADTDLVLFDKTGTLTVAEGRLMPAPGSRAGAFERMAALVSHSGHPLARALEPQTRVPRDVQIVPGSGVTGTVDDVFCRAGSPKWFDELRLEWPEDLARARADHTAKGATLVAIGEAERITGLAVLEQRPAPSAAEAMTMIRSLGLSAEILSGDHPESVRELAQALGIAGEGGLLPEGKLARLEAHRAAGKKVAFVGDGVNDAPVLRAADVGIVVLGGTATATDQAGVRILTADLRSLALFFEGARVLRRCVYGNLFWSVAYNAVALGFAVCGRLHPLVASASMIISSLVVSLRSWKLLDWGKKS